MNHEVHSGLDIPRSMLIPMSSALKVGDEYTSCSVIGQRIWVDFNVFHTFRETVSSRPGLGHGSLGMRRAVPAGVGQAYRNILFEIGCQYLLR